MTPCDCPTPILSVTREHQVCSNCGIVVDKLYENGLSFEQVSHFSNTMVGEVHPTINRTLSYLSTLIDMTFDTRMDIIQRANELVSSAVNYTMATEYAFSEIFPDIDLGITHKTLKKIERVKRSVNECGDECSVTCSRTYMNSYVLDKMNKLRILIQKGHKHKRPIDTILKNVKIPKTTYYANRKITFTHLPDEDIIGLKMRGKKITLEISEFIFSLNGMASKAIADKILYNFHTNISPSAIRKHRRKFSRN